MFDDPNKPMTEQILEEMERQGFPKDAMDYAKEMMYEKKDLTFTMSLVDTLAKLEACHIAHEELELSMNNGVEG